MYHRYSVVEVWNGAVIRSGSRQDKAGVSDSWQYLDFAGGCQQKTSTWAEFERRRKSTDSLTPAGANPATCHQGQAFFPGFVWLGKFW
jgi:hypothetical protein